MPKGKRISYSAAEMAWLEANCLLPITDYHPQFCQAFDQHDVDAGNLHALRKRKGWRTGRTGCFEKGQVATTRASLARKAVAGGIPMPAPRNSAGASDRVWQSSCGSSSARSALSRTVVADCAVAFAPWLSPPRRESSRSDF